MRLTKRKNSSYMKEIQDVIYNTASKYLKTLGWDMNDIADSFICDVEQTDDNRIHVEIRSELEYEDMDKLLELLDSVINVKFDKDAYFDMVGPGISEAYIRTQAVQASTDVSCADNSKMKSVFIDHYRAFDNGNVMHNFQGMSEEQAQALARKASIEDPTDGYFVHYNDIMNPVSDIVWVDGKAYYSTDVKPTADGVEISEGSSPIKLNIQMDEDEVAEEYLNIVYDIVDDIGGLIDYYVDDYGNFVVVFNNNVDNIRDRAQEMLSALAQAGTGAKDWNTNGNNVLIFEMERNYTVQASNESDQQFEYMMLDRLRTDCNYYLKHPHPKYLWAGSVDGQIAEMRKLYDKLKVKPEWLTKEDIDEYEKDMKAISSATRTETEAYYHLGDAVLWNGQKYVIIDDIDGLFTLRPKKLFDPEDFDDPESGDMSQDVFLDASQLRSAANSSAEADMSYDVNSSKSSESNVYNDYGVMTRNGHTYAIRTTSETATEDIFNQFKFAVYRLTPYDDAEYAWCKGERGVIKYYRDGKLLSKTFYLNADDMGVENDKWCDTVIDDAVRTLEKINRDVEPRIIHNSTCIANGNTDAIRKRKAEYDAAYDRRKNKYNAQLNASKESEDYAQKLFYIVEDLAYRMGDVLDYYLDDTDDFVITFSNRVDRDVLSQYAEKMMTAFRNAGVNMIDWDVNGSNIIYFELDDNSSEPFISI